MKAPRKRSAKNASRFRGEPRGEAPAIEDYLDDLLRRTRADARTTRRLLDEAADHLHATADELVAAGQPGPAAEREAVRRFGTADQLIRTTWRHSFVALVRETLGAAIALGACGLIAVGISGGVAAVMTALFGTGFVGGATVLGTGGASVAETAHDAVALRVLAGLIGLVVLAGCALLRKHIAPARVLPPGLVAALGAAAFAAGAVVLAGASVAQELQGRARDGVGFFLSGALVSAVAAVLFCIRATRVLLPTGRGSRRVAARLPGFDRRSA